MFANYIEDSIFLDRTQQTGNNQSTLTGNELENGNVDVYIRHSAVTTVFVWRDNNIPYIPTNLLVNLEIFCPLFYISDKCCVFFFQNSCKRYIGNSLHFYLFFKAIRRKCKEREIKNGKERNNFVRINILVFLDILLNIKQHVSYKH